MLGILQFELKYYFKNKHEVIYIIGFFVIINLISILGMPSNAHVTHEFAISLAWVGSVASIALGTQSLYQRDAQSGMLEIYQQTGHGLLGLALAKYLAFCIANLFWLWLAYAAALMLGGATTQAALHDVLGLAAGGLALATIACLIASLTAGLDRARAITLLLGMPLMVPVIIFGAAYSQQPAWWDASLLFVLAYTVFMLPIMCLASAAAIRASN